MSHEHENIKGLLRENIVHCQGRISELLEESPEPTEARRVVVSTVAQVEAMLAVARSIEYLAETLRDVGEANERSQADR